MKKTLLQAVSIVAGLLAAWLVGSRFNRPVIYRKCGSCQRHTRSLYDMVAASRSQGKATHYRFHKPLSELEYLRGVCSGCSRPYQKEEENAAPS